VLTITVYEKFEVYKGVISKAVNIRTDTAMAKRKSCYEVITTKLILGSF
jgi:hypothetical protein